MIEFRTGVAIRTTHLNEQPTTKYDRNKRKEDKMPAEFIHMELKDALNARCIKIGDKVLKMFPKILLPMLKEKTLKKKFGYVTFYIQQTTTDGILEKKTLDIDFDNLLKWYKEHIEGKEPLDVGRYWYDKESKDNPFIGLDLFFTYPKKLVKIGLCEEFLGAIPQLLYEKRIFDSIRTNYYGCFTTGMWDFSKEDHSPLFKYFEYYFNMGNNKLLLNYKAAKNIIVAQKKELHCRTIAELKQKNYHILRNADFCYGECFVGEHYKGCVLYGDASNIYGRISGITGEIHKDLYGDVSGLSGDITNLYGNATGIELHIGEKLKTPTHINTLLEPDFIKHYHLLSNEENQTLLKVWNVLCHHTIGVTDEERALFDNPVKCKPPFSVDRWGRHYVEDKSKEYVWVYSINPADITFAKDVNKCSTCFCWNSGSNRWRLGMRCLIALDSVNPNLGVIFKIKKDSVKKMNQFNNIKFKWYEPESATFFQYNSKGIYIWNRYEFGNNHQHPCMLWSCEDLFKKIKKIYGHDGINCDHERQKELAYLETFIKKGYRWYRGADESFPLTNNTQDFTKDEISDEWKAQIALANEKAEQLVKELKDK
jgi:hypothetical protein